MFANGIETKTMFVVLLGLSGVTLGLASLLFRQRASDGCWLRRGLWIVLLLQLSALANTVTPVPYGQLTMLAPAVALGLYWPTRPGAAGRSSPRLRMSYTQALGGLVLVGSMAGIGLWLYQLEEMSSPPALDSVIRHQGKVCNLKAISTNPLATDRGSIVPAFVSDVTDLFQPAEEDAWLSLAKLTNEVIRLGSATAGGNCHGWTFSSGQYWIRSSDVPLILEDNGYRQVEFPQAGDLVLYCVGPGQFTHSGIVRTADNGQDLILIESKWCLMGRFLHAPTKCPYRGTCQYYHTDRAGGHLLRGRLASVFLATYKQPPLL